MNLPTLARLTLAATLVLAAGTASLPAQSADTEESAPANRPGGKKVMGTRFGEDPANLEPFVVKKIEDYLGKPLDDEQKAGLKEAYTTLKESLAKVEKTFVEEVSKITGLEERQIAKLDSTPARAAGLRRAKAEDAFVDRLNVVLDKPLTGSQKRQIERAFTQRQKDIEPPREQLTRDVSKITGIPESRVRQLLAVAN